MAGQFSTPVFSPHVTLSGLPSLPASEIVPLLDDLFPDVLPLKVKTGNISCGNNPYQKLIHEIPAFESLYQLAEKVQGQIKEADPRKENFHLSLLYGTMDCENFKAEIPRLEQDLPAEVSLSGYKIVELAANVENWRTISSRTF